MKCPYYDVGLTCQDPACVPCRDARWANLGRPWPPPEVPDVTPLGTLPGWVGPLVMASAVLGLLVLTAYLIAAGLGS